ncbi:DNA replication initiation protein [Geobacillus phage vB_GthS_NIIg9.7]|nr:DNA replication initiation protein [Geobacillus phage vB_GthS_NIIg9.7]
MNKLLFDERPLVVLPTLAVKVGLNEAIILQQLHYWLKDSKNVRDGYTWVYNSYEDWHEQFPFWSVRTIKRIITGLENKGIIVSGCFNKMKADRTKWYRIDYKKLNEVINGNDDMCHDDGDNVERPSCQVGTMDSDELTRPITINYTEITSDIVVEKLEETFKLLETMDEEKRNGVKQVSQFYQDKIELSIPTKTMESIIRWVDKLSPELVLEALKITHKEGKKWNYTEGILNNWLKDGITSLNDLEKQKEKKPAPRRRRQADVWDAFNNYINSLGDEEDE